jgi:maltose/moltooligosaccharide transporter
MWIYCTPAVTQRFYATLSADADLYNSGANWVGVLMGAYNGFAALAAIGIAPLANRIGLGKTHMLCLFAGAAGFASFLVVPNPKLLLVSMVGVGIAWASILSIPYALLADSLPPEKMGVYMGIFNFFIVVPQVLAASVLGTILEGREPIYAFLIGAVCFVIAGFLVLAVRERSVQALR